MSKVIHLEGQTWFETKVRKKGIWNINWQVARLHLGLRLGTDHSYQLWIVVQNCQPKNHYSGMTAIVKF